MRLSLRQWWAIFLCNTHWENFVFDNFDSLKKVTHRLSKNNCKAAKKHDWIRIFLFRKNEIFWGNNLIFNRLLGTWFVCFTCLTCCLAWWGVRSNRKLSRETFFYSAPLGLMVVVFQAGSVVYYTALKYTSFTLQLPPNFSYPLNTNTFKLIIPKVSKHVLQLKYQNCKSKRL